MKEAFSHPAVEGIISFSGPAIAGFKDMPLVDMNFKNTAAGNVVDKLLGEWKSENLETTTDGRGFSPEISLFHGDYDVVVSHPATKSSTSVSFTVSKDSIPQQITRFEIEV